MRKHTTCSVVSQLLVRLLRCEQERHCTLIAGHEDQALAVVVSPKAISARRRLRADTPLGIQVRAATTVLEHTALAIELVDLVERREALVARLAQERAGRDAEADTEQRRESARR